MARKDAQPGLKEAAAARRLKAFNLRTAGATYRAIAEQLNISDKTAHQDVQRIMAVYRAQALESAADYVALEEARLDALQIAHWSKAMRGDIAAGQLVLKISESRRKLLGLDAPAQVTVGGAVASPVYLALRQTVLQLLPAEQRLLLAEALDQVIDATATNGSDEGA